MKSSTESLSPTRIKLTIEVPFEEFEPSLDEAYKTIGSQVTVPGFRKGKVPAAVVDQRVGRTVVLDEAINSVLPQWYSQAVQEQDLQPLSQPEIDLTKFSDGEPIEITAELDIRPEIALPDVSGIEVEVADAEVADSDVDEQIESLRERFATFTEVERPVQDGDSLTIDLAATDKDGKPIDGAEAQGMPYTVGQGEVLDGLDEAVIGLEAGGTATFASQLVGGELKGTDVDVTVTVTDVKERHLPELDDEFAQMASEFDTMDELRTDMVDRVTRGKRMEQANDGPRPRPRRDHRPGRRPAARCTGGRGARLPARAGHPAARLRRHEHGGLPRGRGPDGRRVRGRPRAPRARVDRGPVRARPGRRERRVRHRRHRAQPAHHAPCPAVGPGPELLRPAHHGAQPRARDDERGAARQGPRVAGRVRHGQGRLRQRAGALPPAGRRHHRHRRGAGRREGRRGGGPGRGSGWCSGAGRRRCADDVADAGEAAADEEPKDD